MVATSLRLFELGGVPVWVEAVVLPGSEPTADRTTEAIKRAFESSRDVILDIGTEIVGSARELLETAASPDEISVELGIGVSTTGSLVVMSAGTEASLKLTLTYKRDSLLPPAPELT